MTAGARSRKGSLILYQSPRSTSSKQIRLCFAEKGLSWESRNLDLTRLEQYRPDYLAVNPAGQVPAIIHDGVTLCGSAAIADHIESRFPAPPLIAEDRDERAAARSWIGFVDEVAKPAVFAPTWHRQIERLREAARQPDVMARLDNVPGAQRQALWRRIIETGFTSAELEQSRRTMRLVLSRVEDGLRGTKWLAGDRYSLADIAALVVVERILDLEAASLRRDTFPLLLAWRARIAEGEAYQSAIMTN